MSAVIARALTMIAVVVQSYFNWESDVTPRSASLVPSSKSGAYHLAGLVLARGGSKGIVKKNLAEVNGQPLVGRALDAMVESGVFTTIWVSTDDPEITKWVTDRYSPRTVAIHKRAAYTATDSATSISAVLEFLKFHPEVDAVGLVQATSPFVQAQFLHEAAYKLLPESGAPLLYDSVFSVTRSHQLRWSVEMGRGQTAKKTEPLNFNPRSRPRRQEWSGEMVENGMFYFTYRHVLVDYKVFQSEKSGYVEIPKHLSLEIDTQEDLEIARCLAGKIDGKNRNFIENNRQHFYDHPEDMEPGKSSSARST